MQITTYYKVTLSPEDNNNICSMTLPMYSMVMPEPTTDHELAQAVRKLWAAHSTSNLLGLRIQPEEEFEIISDDDSVVYCNLFFNQQNIRSKRREWVLRQDQKVSKWEEKLKT
jgi:hypothetical protein